MCFLTIEDMVGTVEVIVFPKDYEKYAQSLVEDEKVFVTGRASMDDEKDGKIILEKLVSFSSIARNLWVKFPDKETYEQRESELLSTIHDFEGIDHVIIYLEKERAKKQLPGNQNVRADEFLLQTLKDAFGEDNIKLV